jgi:hypothetical protein
MKTLFYFIYKIMIPLLREKSQKVIKFNCNIKSKFFIIRYLCFHRNTAKKYISLFEVLGIDIETVNTKAERELYELFPKDLRILFP